MNQFADPAKLENAKAQYQAVLGETRVTKEELESILVRRAEAQNELNDVCVKLDDASGELAFTEKKRSEIELMVESASKKLTDIEQTIRETEAYAEKSKNRISRDITALDGIIKSRKESLASTERGIKELSAKTAAIYKEAEEQTTQLDRILKRVQDAGQELDTLQNALSNAQNRASIELKELEGRVVAARALAAQEEAKIVSYEEHAAKDKKTMARRESDLLVIKKRYDELFKKLYVRH